MLNINKQITVSRVAMKYCDNPSQYCDCQALRSGSLVRATRLSRVRQCRGFKNLGKIKERDMNMRGSHIEQALLGSTWTGLPGRGSPSSM